MPMEAHCSIGVACHEVANVQFADQGQNVDEQNVGETILATRRDELIIYNKEIVRQFMTIGQLFQQNFGFRIFVVGASGRKMPMRLVPTRRGFTLSCSWSLFIRENNIVAGQTIEFWKIINEDFDNEFRLLAIDRL